MKENKLMSLAKGAKKAVVPVVKKVEVKKVVKKTTPEEERDLKAKETVAKLLEDIPLNPNEKVKEQEKSEVASSTQLNDNSWLQEQVEALSSEMELLRTELGEAKENYAKIFAENQRLKNGSNSSDVMDSNVVDDSALKQTVVRIFNELQQQHLKLGRNFVIVPPAFMNRLIMFFPFLEGEKKF